MKQTILICDCCRLPVPAVKSVDLCAKHIKMLGFNRRARHNPHKNKPESEVLKERKRLILEVLKHGKPMTPKAMAESLGLPSYTLIKALNQLRTSQTIKRTGVARTAKYLLP